MLHFSGITQYFLNIPLTFELIIDRVIVLIEVKSLCGIMAPDNVFLTFHDEWG